MAFSIVKYFSEIVIDKPVFKYKGGSHFNAMPTYLISPDSFFVISLRNLSHLRKFSKPGKQMKVSELEENMVVIYRSEDPDVKTFLRNDLDENIRGVIQSINEDKTCQVYALDRGFTEINVTVDRLFHPANQESVTEPSLIQHCELDCCEPKGLTFSVSEVHAFELFIGKKKISVVVKSIKNDKLSVAIYNDFRDDLASVLAYSRCTLREKGKYYSEATWSTPLPYKHKVLSINEILYVRVLSVSSPSEFYVTPIKGYEEYVQYGAGFTSYCKSLKNISRADFTLGVAVGVLETSDASYERGVILNVSGDSAKVKLVDWGVEKTIFHDYLRKINCNVYLESPVKAIFCSAVKEIEPWDKQWASINLFTGNTFKIKVEQKGFGFWEPYVVSIIKE